LYKFYFKSIISPNTNIFPKIRIVQLKQIPFPKLDIEKSSEKLIYHKITENAEKIMNYYNELANLKIQSQKDNVLRKIKFSENEINKHVYQLYDISEKEIEIIEKNAQ